MIKKLKTYDSDNLQIGGKNEQISRENSESFFWKEKISNDFSLVKTQYINIIQNPEILYNDLEKFNSRVNKIKNMF